MFQSDLPGKKKAKWKEPYWPNVFQTLMEEEKNEIME